MSEFELQQLLSDNRELISDTWYYFLTVHLAIFGIVYVATRRVRIAERLMLAIAYSGFLAVNYSAQSENYLEQQRLIALLSELKGALERTTPTWDVAQNLVYAYAGAALLSLILMFLTGWSREQRV